ncbi:PPOX class F420-dependent oxidoreductase [Streptomyces abikoensis]
MTPVLSESVRALVDAPNFVTLSTVGRDGAPHSSPMWITREGDELLLSTVLGRRKERNLRVDGRVSITVLDPADPYRYAEIRGEARITGDGGPELIHRLARKYTGDDYQWDSPDAVRVVIRVTPSQVAGTAARQPASG